ncbi:hypothetical protein Bca52824_011186 [Brassica carinata]|uniref:GRF-type domain-containing protein n=1 Tax=Brassica carinata TaxID=52824 RepID=A0A8X7WCS5_BRACI|nr:hypothetical protein Bca52824_011186 [Brassica carinata]
MEQLEEERKIGRKMEFGGRWTNKGKGKPAKNSQAWTDKNPGRRFYGCERFKTELDCGFFQWIDEGQPYGKRKL